MGRERGEESHTEHSMVLSILSPNHNPALGIGVYSDPKSPLGIEQTSSS